MLNVFIIILLLYILNINILFLFYSRELRGQFAAAVARGPAADGRVPVHRGQRRAARRQQADHT